jgi:two-component system, NtrC family, nitrogen regulation sensor histidine kinase NtrY
VRLTPKLTYWFYIGLSALSLLLATFLGLFSVQLNPENETKHFQHILIEKETSLTNTLTQVDKQLENADSISNLWNNTSLFKQAKEKREIIFFLQNDSLKIWSDNSLSLNTRDIESLRQNTLIKLTSGWYLGHVDSCKNGLLIGLILIKNEFPIENKHLQNEFAPEFNIAPQTQIKLNAVEKRHAIYSNSGKYLFSLDYRNSNEKSNFIYNICLLLYLLCPLFLLIAAVKKIKILSNRRKKYTLLFFTLLLFISLYVIFRFIGLPSAIAQGHVFSPELFATTIFPSLADLFLFCYLLFLSIYFICSFNFKFRVNKRSSQIIIITTGSLVISTFFFFITFIFHDLIINSSISFELHKILELSVFSIVALGCIAFLFSSFGFVFERLIQLILSIQKSRLLFLIFPIIATITYMLFYLMVDISIISLFFLIIFEGVFFSLRIKQKFKYSYPSLIVITAIFSIFSTWYIIDTNRVKEQNNKKVLALNLANEHDPVAELLLDDLVKKISSDKQLPLYIFEKPINVNKLYSYIQRKFFSGFWQKYDLRLNTCSPSDSIYLASPDNSWAPCYSFFNDLLNHYGVKLQNSKFYFLDYNNGQVCYFGWFDFSSTEDGTERTLFIELNSKFINEALGYPELLLNQNLQPNPEIADYCYAKYYKGSLISQSGSFQYGMTLNEPKTKKEEYSFVKSNGYNHLLYHIDENNTYIVSKPSIRFLDIMITLSYIFAFAFIIVTLIISLVDYSIIRQSLTLNFKNKIQFSTISLLSLSLIIAGLLTVFFNIKQYQSKQKEIIAEKILSVSNALYSRTSQNQSISGNWDSYEFENLNELLINLSNIFYADINLFDTKGQLISTSRPEIYERGLSGRIMNPNAYYEMVIQRRPEYVHQEKIGQLTFLSAYVPFFNNNNHLIGYINLPYFSKQDVFTRELANLIVALVNIYVFFIMLALGFAVVLSNRITQPLRLLKEKMAHIDLSHKSEPLSYKGNDEIASLVIEYNKMVDALAKSAELLAKSERESAWREMAKQVAHEIKNPLTPMKLSVQHLQRAWANKSASLEENMAKTTRTLIEQIDTLSGIATEFSNFAKMPQAVSERFNIVERINQTVCLFDNTEEARVTFDLKHPPIFINADKEQMQRVLINLIKNGIQSVPLGKQAEVDITIEQGKNVVRILISDNGSGIPDDMRDKLFRPNFTTKSSGMGMGLAIVKNIIESAGGSINYNTNPRHGTTFIVELPAID